MFLAIDPGISTGWAVFNADKQLQICGVGQPPTVGIKRVLIERPQIYRASQSKGDPNDLITLALGAGRYAERFESRGAVVDFVLPTTWKGQVPKAIHHVRIYGALAAAEQEIVSRGGSGVSVKAREDMMDAVGLGVWGRRFPWRAI